jgi:hypothetical protein
LNTVSGVAALCGIRHESLRKKCIVYSLFCEAKPASHIVSRFRGVMEVLTPP